MKRVRVLIVVVLAGLATLASRVVEAEVPFIETGVDLSADYRRIYECYRRFPSGRVVDGIGVSGYQRCRPYFLTTSEIERLKRIRFILVSGMQYELVTALVYRLPQALRVIAGAVEDASAFPKQERVLRRLGIRYTTFNLGWQPPQNFSKREMIQNAIRRSPRCVVLMGHSKGGVDILDALVSLREGGEIDTFEKVVGFLPVQSPLQGTPHADGGGRARVFDDQSGESTTTFQSIVNNMSFLSTTERLAWLDEHRESIEQINDRITTISFGSYLYRTQTSLSTIFAIMMRPTLWASGELNDGLVAYRGTGLPGSARVVEPGIDHVSTAMRLPVPQTPYDQDAFFFALLKLQVERMRSCG